jgi:hypothetical protein
LRADIVFAVYHSPEKTKNGLSEVRPLPPTTSGCFARDRHDQKTVILSKVKNLTGQPQRSFALEESCGKKAQDDKYSGNCKDPSQKRLRMTKIQETAKILRKRSSG